MRTFDSYVLKNSLGIMNSRMEEETQLEDSQFSYSSPNMFVVVK
jgi:hypothetical protein